MFYIRISKSCFLCVTLFPHENMRWIPKEEDFVKFVQEEIPIAEENMQITEDVFISNMIARSLTCNISGVPMFNLVTFIVIFINISHHCHHYNHEQQQHDE